MTMVLSAARSATVERRTRETNIRATVTLDGAGRAEVRTGLGFLDHMLTSLACHSGFDVALACEGDLHVDDHHTVEDCAIVLGQALDAALGTREGLTRFGEAHAPMDEALARCCIDLVTRPCAVVSLGLTRERLGDVSCENLKHFFSTLAVNGRFTLHVDVLRGENDHHKAEAAFKSTALALARAVAPSARGGSTKGAL
jgi:imidazoleglycerol-phosphate dehydratase